MVEEGMKYCTSIWLGFETQILEKKIFLEKIEIKSLEILI